MPWDFGVYLRQVFWNLWGLALLLNGTLGVWARITKRPATTTFSVAILAILFVGANYQAWHGEHEKAEEVSATGRHIRVDRRRAIAAALKGTGQALKIDIVVPKGNKEAGRYADDFEALFAEVGWPTSRTLTSEPIVGLAIWVPGGILEYDSEGHGPPITEALRLFGTEVLMSDDSIAPGHIKFIIGDRLG